MDDTTPAASAGTPLLWTRAMVEQWVNNHAGSDLKYAMVLASDIVHDYERELASLRAANADLRAIDKARIAELETTARLLRQHIMVMDAEMLAMEEQEDDE